jgi:hypothetical protein
MVVRGRKMKDVRGTRVGNGEGVNNKYPFEGAIEVKGSRKGTVAGRSVK